MARCRKCSGYVLTEHAYCLLKDGTVEHVNCNNPVAPEKDGKKITLVTTKEDGTRSTSQKK
jgi:hypothetical protein